MSQEDAINMSNEQAIQILIPFRDMMIDQHGCPISDAVFALDKAIEALQTRQEIIRCSKCIYWQQNTVRQNSNDAGWWNEALCERHTIYGNEPHEAWVDADWYCADAERREDEA